MHKIESVKVIDEEEDSERSPVVIKESRRIIRNVDEVANGSALLSFSSQCRDRSASEHSMASGPQDLVNLLQQ